MSTEKDGVASKTLVRSINKLILWHLNGNQQNLELERVD